MTEDMMRAEAAEAEREANAIFAKIEEARGPTGPLTPAGFERDRERASDLMRLARTMTAEADEMRAEAAPVRLAPSPAAAPAAKAPEPAPAKPVEPVETAETVALRILNSDSTAPDRAPAPQGLGAGAVDANSAVEVIARRILEA